MCFQFLIECRDPPGSHFTVQSFEASVSDISKLRGLLGLGASGSVLAHRSGNFLGQYHHSVVWWSATAFWGKSAL